MGSPLTFEHPFVEVVIHINIERFQDVEGLDSQDVAVDFAKSVDQDEKIAHDVGEVSGVLPFAGEAGGSPGISCSTDIVAVDVCYG